MCGIAGIIQLESKASPGSLQRMNEMMVHRGPDALGVCFDTIGKMSIGLAHRRLAILDLSPLGQQPMSTKDQQYRLVFNGEIYNFLELRQELEAEGDHFVSNSDTEVLLAGLSRYGIEFVRRLHGMYAFAFFDRSRGSIYLARDPVGIKPLFYYHGNNSLAFASELRSLVASELFEPVASQASVANYFAYGSIAQPSTILSDASMLDSGSWTEYAITDDQIREVGRNRWWAPSKPTRRNVNYAAETRRLVTKAVHSHLMADVPVGVFLSAGIDSTIIATVAHEKNPNTRAFTVSFESDVAIDESEIAMDTAQKIGMEHVLVKISDEEALSSIQDWFNQIDKPSIDGLNTFVISKAVRGQGIKVALSGVGADELFGGYPSFQEVPQLYYWARRAAIVPDFLRRMLARSLTFQKPIQVSQKLQDMFSIQPRLSWLAAMRRRLMSQHDLKQLGFQFDDLGLSPIGLPPKTMMQLPIESDDAGWTISVVESALYQGNTLLRDADANSMAHSLELRVPFLDQELIDFAHSIPGEIRFPKDGPRKFLLREAFGDVISDVIHKRPKTGFSLPIARWMLKQLRPLCEEGVNYVAMSGLVNKKGVKALWASFLADPNERSWTRAFSIVVLGHYLKNLDRYKSSHPLTTPKFVDKEWAGCSGSC